MEKLSYNPQDLNDRIKAKENILDANTRDHWQLKLIGRGARQAPVYSSGRFCTAYLFESRGEKLCFRVWKNLIDDSLSRYDSITKYLKAHRLPYFVPFDYVPKALLMADGNTLPGLRMEWIEGKTLNEFIRHDWANMSNDERLDFIRQFYTMCHDLRDNKIAHGDLSCKNILVTPSRQIRLVDYDSMYVPTMGRKLQTTAGAVGFQHPDRLAPPDGKPLYVSADDDNFSQLVIALSLWVAMLKYDDVKAKYDEELLLFEPYDLGGKTPAERLNLLHASAGWKLAKACESLSPPVKALLPAIEAVAKPLSQVPSITALSSRSQIASWRTEKPQVAAAPYCMACGLKFEHHQHRFCPRCGAKRILA